MKAKDFLKSIGFEHVEDEEFYNHENKKHYKVQYLMEKYHQYKLKTHKTLQDDSNLYSLEDMKKCAEFWNGGRIEQKNFKKYMNDRQVFNVASETPYNINDIIDFMALTGIKLKETEVLLKRFNEAGIVNIKDVNTIVKFGYFHYR
jgi:hypothetical protein